MTHDHTTETVQSGDVALFVRRFGRPGRTPLLILHGGNYFDSADWVDIGGRLGHDRAVAAFDARGFGQSGWSADKDYSHAAMLADIEAVLDHLSWTRAVMIGHSRGGAYALLAAARLPQRAAGLVLVDYNPARGFGPPPGAAVSAAGASPPVFPTVEAAIASMSRQKNIPPGSAARRRVMEFLKPVEGGFQLAARDPAFLNQTPISGVQSRTAVNPRSGHDELEITACPLLAIRATQSMIYKPEELASLSERKGAEGAEIHCGHDVPGEAPDHLVAIVAAWLSKI